MAIREFYVSISPTEAMSIIKKSILQGNVTGTLIDSYARNAGEYEVFVFILEKYYMRSNNRASLTVTIDNFDNETKVHAVASGSSAGVIYSTDSGAGEHFVASVETALRTYITRVE